MKTKLKRMAAFVIITLTLEMCQLSHATEIKLEEIKNDEVSKKISPSCTSKILELACIDQIKQEKPLINLRLVCKKWYQLIHQLIKKDRPIDSPFYKIFYDISGPNEDIFERFLKGVLIYKPNLDNDEGLIKLRICDLANSLKGEVFDLSKFGDMWKFLSINTAFRIVKEQENANKVEIWIAPWFLIKQKLETTAKHFKPIMDKWDPKLAPVIMCFNWGGDTDLGCYYYLSTESMENLSKCDLGENYQKSRLEENNHPLVDWLDSYNSILKLRGQHFRVCFLN